MNKKEDVLKAIEKVEEKRKYYSLYDRCNISIKRF